MFGDGEGGHRVGGRRLRGGVGTAVGVGRWVEVEPGMAGVRSEVERGSTPARLRDGDGKLTFLAAAIWAGCSG